MDKKQYMREYCRTHREQIRRSSRKYFLAHKAQHAKRISKYYYAHKAAWRLRAIKAHKKIRLEVLSHYSHGKMKCALCSFRDIRALSMDHIGGGGNAHRRKIGEGRIYRWLKRNKYPKGFRVLCMNHQFIVACNKRLKMIKSRYTLTY